MNWVSRCVYEGVVGWGGGGTGCGMCGMYPCCGVRHSKAFSRRGVESKGKCVFRVVRSGLGLVVICWYRVS